MCGIICGHAKDVYDNEIHKALSSLSHRGPDASTLYKKEDIFLGHTRLSIVDIVGGEQPLFNEDNSIVAVVNGEFYDYQTEKLHLIQKGHVFKTNSDSEMLVHLYEEYGVECLKKLHGEFAFVLYDHRKKRWFCARDRAGVRPLQFYWEKQKFFIASEIKAILNFSEVKTAFNRENFWFSQHMQYLPLDGTLFNNIHMIRPGHFLLLEDEGVPKQYEYWNLHSIEPLSLTFAEASEKAVFLLEDAVKKRIPLEVPWASHLSGGLDSSIVSALSQPYQKSQKTCFTIQFTDDGFYDESALATETAHLLDAQLIKIPVSSNDIVDVLPEAVYHAEGLSINGHLGAKYLLNKAIKDMGFKVALSGEGADEIFMGYSHLKQDFLSIHHLGINERQYLSGIQLPDGETLNLECFQQKLGFIPTWVAAKSSMAVKFKNLWHKDFVFSNNPYEKALLDFTEHSSQLKTSSASWMKFCLNGYILKVLDDAQAMAHSIEGRLPFLDTELIEFMYSLPDHLYFEGKTEKNILREGFKNKIPHNVIAKTKQSFMSPPIHRFLMSPRWIQYIEEYVYDNTSLHDLNIFDTSKIYNFIEQAKKQEAPSLEPILMTLLSVGTLVKKFNI